MIEIYIDADACPVKDEIYKVAERYDIPVLVVSNSYMRIPRESWIKQVVVSDGFDAADDYIAERAEASSIVITSDILLAERCIKQSATVISPTGKPFTENSIGMAVATRSIMADLRAGGDQIGGQAPFSKADRSRFLSALDLAIVQLKRELGV
ncbi:MAG: YaiI/YqxD family protein [Lentilitoribacter sp.]